MRLVIARCTVGYVGRLTAHLPSAPRLILVKADGSVSIHADDRAYKPLNWMSRAYVRIRQELAVPAVKKEPSRESARALLVVLFVIYLALLTWIVLWKLEVPWTRMGALRGIGLIPFGDGFAKTTASLVEVVANLLLFVPFGIYLGLLAPSWSWWKIAGTFAGASLCFEIAQYVLAIGRSDVTDVTVNVTGGLAGLGILALTRRTLGDRTVAIVTRVCLVGTVLAVLASGVFFVSPLHYAQHEVAASSISSLGGVER